jgi:hypothetical protein
MASKKKVIKKMSKKICKSLIRNKKNKRTSKKRMMKGGAVSCPPTILEPGFKVSALGDVKGLDIPDTQAYLKKTNVKSVSHPMIR